ncbi:PREDICTED: uncharacterized protein LOC106803268 [Ceratotherium simum simum]|uniref:Uncharacterized protein LOC106803268 n=1 Tax=Ceratotherium simum simum TaxID=73337 RepID=A0ABM1DCX8_CERSS|nr:PREDICTED: uncharacterized protein LOC106803268 [Ceratotherium simum simum]
MMERGRGPHLCLCRGAEWEQPARVRCRSAPATAGTVTNPESDLGGGGGERGDSRAGTWRLGFWDAALRHSSAALERSGYCRQGAVWCWRGGVEAPRFGLVGDRRGERAASRKREGIEGFASPPPPLGGGEIALAGRAQPLARRWLCSRAAGRAAPEAEPRSCPRVPLPPPGGQRRAPCCPPSRPRPRGLRLIFPAGKLRAADKGMPVVLRVSELGGPLIPPSPLQERKG